MEYKSVDVYLQGTSRPDLPTLQPDLPTLQLHYKDLTFLGIWLTVMGHYYSLLLLLLILTVINLLIILYHYINILLYYYHGYCLAFSIQQKSTEVQGLLDELTRTAIKAVKCVSSQHAVVSSQSPVSISIIANVVWERRLQHTHCSTPHYISYIWPSVANSKWRKS